jgi:hypothetical protein
MLTYKGILTVDYRITDFKGNAHFASAGSVIDITDYKERLVAPLPGQVDEDESLDPMPFAYSLELGGRNFPIKASQFRAC